MTCHELFLTIVGKATVLSLFFPIFGQSHTARDDVNVFAGCSRSCRAFHQQPMESEVGTITFEGETDCSNLDFQDGHGIIDE